MPITNGFSNIFRAQPQRNGFIIINQLALDPIQVSIIDLHCMSFTNEFYDFHFSKLSFVVSRITHPLLAQMRFARLHPHYSYKARFSGPGGS